MKAVLDTSGWYASASKVDEMHREAAIFISAEHDLLILETVFEEIVALFQNRFGKKIAASHGSALRNAGLTLLSKEEITRAWGLFLKTSTQVSFVDCTVVTIAKELNLPVFGFDVHLSKLGVQLVP